jgi:hypothetical protein
LLPEDCNGRGNTATTALGLDVGEICNPSVEYPSFSEGSISIPEQMALNPRPERLARQLRREE